MEANKKETYAHNVIKRILEDNYEKGLGLETKKKFTIHHETEDYINFIIPYWTAFDSIYYVVNKIQSKDSKSKTFLFYENFKGYNLLSFDDALLSAYKNKSYDRKYLYQLANANKKDIRAEFETAHEFRNLKELDQLKDFVSGINSSTLFKYDYLSGKLTQTELTPKIINSNSNSMEAKYTITTYDMNSSLDFYEPKITNDTQSANDLKLEYGNSIYTMFSKDQLENKPDIYKTQKIYSYITTNSMSDVDSVGAVYSGIENSPEDYMQIRNMNMNLLNSINISITAFGKTSYNIGDIVAVYYPNSYPDETKNSQVDALYTAQYLVTKIRHVFQKTSHKVIQELSRPCYAKVEEGNDGSYHDNILL